MPNIIADDVVVTIDYTLKNAAGEVLDSSIGDEPLTYLQGYGNIVVGLEKALAGKAAGDAFSVAVSPEEGYGELDEEGLKELDREELPEELELEIGMQLTAELDDGELIPLWVKHIGEETVTVDANHPLAGETLYFDIKVIELRAALPNEIAHGHPHGRDGHSGHHH